MDSSDSKNTFIKHVFNFDDESKAEILNILQYALLSIIPIIILNKSLQTYIPDADSAKSSLEISAEIVIQIVVMFMGLLLINRVITFIPTYSEAKYPEFKIMYIILAILMITVSLKTKLGEKASILMDRLVELWEGKKASPSAKGKVTISQPISNNHMNPMLQQSPTEGTAISALPMPSFDLPMSSASSSSSSSASSSLPSSQMNNSGMGMMDPFEPMAANSALGGGGFGSW